MDLYKRECCGRGRDPSLVLANGQSMFSCEPNPAGEYELNVPLNNYGEIILYSFVDGCKPFKAILAPAGTAVSFDITMTASDGTEPKINLTTEFGVAETDPDWIKISGYVMAGDGTPLCAMVLANGQHMFTCNPTGEHELEVPLPDDGSDQITIFAFAEGFGPFRQTLDIRFKT
ncbi:MAG: hypothetical protein GY795_03600 [Desulfobacterales bacterium]|nr:hypothetical protein [Desulfobacterales bacterium]